MGSIPKWELRAASVSANLGMGRAAERPTQARATITTDTAFAMAVNRSKLRFLLSTRRSTFVLLS